MAAFTPSISAITLATSIAPLTIRLRVAAQAWSCAQMWRRRPSMWRSAQPRYSADLPFSARRAFDAGAGSRSRSGTGVILFCGRFEGLDQRVIEARQLEEISIGDYVLSGGEIAGMVLIDACVRLLARRHRGGGIAARRKLRKQSSGISSLYQAAGLGRTRNPRSSLIRGSCPHRAMAERERRNADAAKPARSARRKQPALLNVLVRKRKARRMPGSHHGQKPRSRVLDHLRLPELPRFARQSAPALATRRAALEAQSPDAHHGCFAEFQPSRCTFRVCSDSTIR